MIVRPRTRWFYEISQPGDIVEVRNTGGALLKLWQNGDWSVPWPQWPAGSATNPRPPQARAIDTTPSSTLTKREADGPPPR